MSSSDSSSSESDKTQRRQVAFRSPTESTPLLSAEASRFAQRSDVLTFLHLMQATWNYNWISICSALVSCIVCVREGYASQAIFDPLIFKSIFVVFGFAIGFRNVRANTRRSSGLASIRGLIHIVWDIVVMIPDERRTRIQEQLLDACDAIAEHVTVVASRRTFHYALAGLEPIPKDGTEESAETALRLGPNTFVAATMLTVEDEIDRLTAEHPQTQKYRRTFWAKKLAFDNHYANLCDLAVPSVSDSYVMLISFCLFVFGIVLPWGLKCIALALDGFWLRMSQGTFLIMNTMVVLIIVLGLNTLASENEDPFRESTEKIDLKSIFSSFSAAMRQYDARRRAASANDDLVDLHRLLREHGKQHEPQPLLRTMTLNTALP